MLTMLQVCAILVSLPVASPAVAPFIDRTPGSHSEPTPLESLARKSNKLRVRGTLPSPWPVPGSAWQLGEEPGVGNLEDHQLQPCSPPPSASAPPCGQGVSTEPRAEVFEESNQPPTPAAGEVASAAASQQTDPPAAELPPVPEAQPQLSPEAPGQVTVESCKSLCRLLNTEMSSTLPNVLVVGDNTSLGYFPTVQALLQPVAKLHHAALFEVPGLIPPDVCGTAAGAVQCMDSWLGNDTAFKVIVFNWGLVDLRVSNNHVSNTYPRSVKEMYLKLVKHRASQGKIIWLNISPVSPFNAGPATNVEIDRANQLVDRMWEKSEHPPERADLNRVVTHSCRLNHAQKAFPDDVECSSLMEPQSPRFHVQGNQFLGMYVAQLIRDRL